MLLLMIYGGYNLMLQVSRLQTEFGGRRGRFYMNNQLPYVLPIGENSSSGVGIGIIGGVGPMAGVALHRRLIAMTDTNGTDQDHIDVLHVSCASVIADRTAYLLNQASVNPAVAAADAAAFILQCFNRSGRRCILGIPCATFHAPPIFDVFIDRLNAPHGTVINMLEKTVEVISNQTDSAQRIGLLTTTGTLRNGIWETLLTQKGHSAVRLGSQEQAQLQSAIYDSRFGLKACYPFSREAVRLVEHSADILIDRGADAILLGCTELPMVFEDRTVLRGKSLIDPLAILASELITAAGRKTVAIRV